MHTVIAGLTQQRQLQETLKYTQPGWLHGSKHAGMVADSRRSTNDARGKMPEKNGNLTRCDFLVTAALCGAAVSQQQAVQCGAPGSVFLRKLCGLYTAGFIWKLHGSC